MKYLFLILTILTISFSCKKQSVEPAPEPEPIKTNKSFQVKITFTSDSLCDMLAPIPGYYPSGYNYWNSFTISIDTIPNSITMNSKNISVAGSGPTVTIELILNITSNDLNKPFTYYIHVKEQLRKPDGTYVWFRYNKLHTFHEGDNGTINFNTLP